MEGKKQKQNQKQLPASCSRVTKPISSAIQTHQEPPGFLLEVCHSATKMLQVQKLEEKSPSPLPTAHSTVPAASNNTKEAKDRSLFPFIPGSLQIAAAFYFRSQDDHRCLSFSEPNHALPPQKQFHRKPSSLPKSSAS